MTVKALVKALDEAIEHLLAKSRADEGATLQHHTDAVAGHPLAAEAEIGGVAGAAL